MNYTVLYRKYRPYNFDDLIGQDIVVKILKASITNNKIGHAYIFSGPRGTGKTSIAKIFAKSVNCENPVDGNACEKCSTCLQLKENDIDIIEIDAASNNGVDEIREIRNNAKLVPSIAKYKVYIVDEVHMLSGSAFNALLKTLEEPPEHVIFILATTEIHKIPLTVLSRCQRFDFKKISPDKIRERINYILKKEKTKLDNDTIDLIVELSDGGLRDAINMVDQMIYSQEDNNSKETLYSLSGNVPSEEIEQLFAFVCNNDVENTLKIINKFYEEGKNFINITEKLMLLIRNISISNNTHNYFSKDISDKLEKFSMVSNENCKEITEKLLNLSQELKKSTNQKIIFEICFIDLCTNNCNKEIINSSIIKEKIIDSPVKENLQEVPEIPENDEDLENTYKDLINIRINNTLATADKNIKTNFIKNFDIIDDYLSDKNYNNIVKILKECTIEAAGENYILFTMSTKNKINGYLKLIDDIELFINKVFKNKYKTSVITSKEWLKVKNKYIDDINNGIIYELKEEKEREKVIISKKTKVENAAIDLFGEDNINIK